MGRLGRLGGACSGEADRARQSPATCRGAAVLCGRQSLPSCSGTAVLQGERGFGGRPPSWAKHLNGRFAGLAPPRAADRLAQQPFEFRIRPEALTAVSDELEHSLADSQRSA